MRIVIITRGKKTVLVILWIRCAFFFYVNRIGGGGGVNPRRIVARVCPPRLAPIELARGDVSYDWKNACITIILLLCSHGVPLSEN